MTETDSRQRILTAARDLFAEKGFDKTSVSDIASTAGVNKALIYYYFESKRAILDSLFSSLVEEVRSLFSPVVQDYLSSQELLQLDETTVQQLFDAILDFLLQHKKLVKTLVAESLKSENARESYLFKISDMLIWQENQRIKQWCQQQGIEYYVDEKLMIVTEFFTGFMPLIGFVIYFDEWQEHYDIDAADLRRCFYQALRMTHMNYHIEQLLGEPNRQL